MSADVTELLQRAARGDKHAEADLLPRIYRELHKIARAHLSRERPGHTLQATALVHEAYLRLAQQNASEWKSRTQFFGLAAQQMRRILVDYARQRNAAKRGSGKSPVELDDALMVSQKDCALVLEVDQALEKLEQLNPRQARVVELRFFSGLSMEEIAEVLEISSRTVKRDWTLARAWLYAELSR